MRCVKQQLKAMVRCMVGAAGAPYYSYQLKLKSQMQQRLKEASKTNKISKSEAAALLAHSAPLGLASPSRPRDPTTSATPMVRDYEMV